jgi:hypothetical protein
MSNVLPKLDNFHIDRFFQDIIGNKKYVKCVSKDALETMKPKRSFCIVNSRDYDDRSDEAHWICFYLLDDNYAIMFDSYGSYANEDMLNYVRKVSKKYNLQIVMNNSQYQEIGTNSCGFFCIFVLLNLLAGYTYKEVLDNFNEKKLEKNEKLISSYFKNTKLTNGKSLLTYLTEKLY